MASLQNRIALCQREILLCKRSCRGKDPLLESGTIQKFALKKKKHTPTIRCVYLSNPHLSFAAGFGTTLSQVAGFHRAVPSTTLDKACMQFQVLILQIFSHLSTPKTLFFRRKLFIIPLWTFLPKTDMISILFIGAEWFEKSAQKLRAVLLSEPQQRYSQSDVVHFHRHSHCVFLKHGG